MERFGTKPPEARYRPYTNSLQLSNTFLRRFVAESVLHPPPKRNSSNLHESHGPTRPGQGGHVPNRGYATVGETRSDARMPEGPRLEARRAESGGRVLGELAASPIPTSCLGERCKIPQRVRGGVPATKGFSRILNTQDDLSGQHS